MGCCGQNKRKYTCGSKINSVCVFYEGYIPKYSELYGEDCIVVEEVLEDLYKSTETIKENTDLDKLGKKCIDYDEEETGKIKVKEALYKQEEILCKLMENIQESPSIIDISKIDPKCLIDDCNTQFTSIEQLLQTMINKICECCPNKEMNINNNNTGIL